MMTRLRKVVPFLGSAACLFAIAAPVEAAGDAARGEAIAQKNCSTCHAVGKTGSSPYPLAPPFRTLHQKYDVEGLAEAFAEGIVVGNSGERQMPRFIMSVEQIEDMIAYLKSLEAKFSRPLSQRPS
jgi:cytochrome c